jgi:hypothetical protein
MAGREEWDLSQVLPYLILCNPGAQGKPVGGWVVGIG